jgi:hypothetical protein
MPLSKALNIQIFISIHTVACLLKARIVKPGEAAIAR